MGTPASITPHDLKRSGQFASQIYRDAFKRAEAAIPEKSIALGSVAMTKQQVTAAIARGHPLIRLGPMC
jgi:hypothetical protein